MSVTENTVAAPKPGNDRSPCILVCNWSSEAPVWDLVEDLSGIPWNPDNARTELIIGGDDIKALAEELVNRLVTHQARALLLIGRTRYDGPARLQIRAEIPRTEGARFSENGPGVVRPTAPTSDILEAANKAKVALIASSQTEEDEGSALLYLVMAALEDHSETPAVAMIRFPAAMPEASIATTVKTAVNVMTQHMAPQRASMR